MKINWILTTILLLLSACGKSSDLGMPNLRCNKSVCIGYSFSGPIKANEPITLTVKISIKEDSPEIIVGINPGDSIEFNDFYRVQDGQKPKTTNGTDMGWVFDGKAGETYTFSGTLIFPMPPEKRTGQYWIYIGVVGPKISHLNFAPTIFINTDGMQISADEVTPQGPLMIGEGTVLPVVTDNPGMEFPISPEEWEVTQQYLRFGDSTPTITVTPAITPTMPGYPAP